MWLLLSFWNNSWISLSNECSECRYVVNKSVRYVSVGHVHCFYEIIRSQLRTCEGDTGWLKRAARWTAAGCLHAARMRLPVAVETVVSPTQLNSRASGCCQWIIIDDALIGSLMQLSDRSLWALPLTTRAWFLCFALTFFNTLCFSVCSSKNRFFMNEITKTHRRTDTY